MSTFVERQPAPEVVEARMEGSTMYDAAVITTIYNDYDPLKPVCPQRELNVDWVLVTDHPPVDSLGWRVVYSPSTKVPGRAAKLPKCKPWLFTDAPASVYLDASFTVHSPWMVSDILSSADPIAQFGHTYRDCIFEEAEYAAKIPYYAQFPLSDQSERYRADGHPEHWGLWASGAIGRRHTAEVRRLGERWLREIDTWGLMCQVSEPYILRKLDLCPRLLLGSHRDNPWMSFKKSVSHPRQIVEQARKVPFALAGSPLSGCG